MRVADRDDESENRNPRVLGVEADAKIDKDAIHVDRINQVDVRLVVRIICDCGTSIEVTTVQPNVICTDCKREWILDP